MDKVKKASRVMVDTGAKTILKVSIRKILMRIFTNNVFIMCEMIALKYTYSCIDSLQLAKVTFSIVESISDKIDSRFLLQYIQGDIALLEREIKTRKQTFGVEVYDCMIALEVDNDMPMEEKEQKIRLSFDRARKDIAVIQAKIECKKEEIATLEAEMAAKARGEMPSYSIPPSSGNVITEDIKEGFNNSINTGFKEFQE